MTNNPFAALGRAQQQANTFAIKSKLERIQPSNEFRPSNFIQSVPDDVKPLVSHVNETFRQTFDQIQGLRNAFGPLVLFSSGNSTGTPISVPVQASQNKLGTGLGLVFSLSRPGTWIVSAAVNLQIVGDTSLFTLSLMVGATAVPYSAQFQPSANQIVMLCQNWQVTSETGDELVTLWIKKVSGAGTSKVVQPNSTMVATWQGRSE